jgi:hypothetical protein
MAEVTSPPSSPPFFPSVTCAVRMAADLSHSSHSAVMSSASRVLLLCCATAPLRLLHCATALRCAVGGISWVGDISWVGGILSGTGGPWIVTTPWGSRGRATVVGLNSYHQTSKPTFEYTPYHHATPHPLESMHRVALISLARRSLAGFRQRECVQADQLPMTAVHRMIPHTSDFCHRGIVGSDLSKTGLARRWIHSVLYCGGLQVFRWDFRLHLPGSRGVPVCGAAGGTVCQCEGYVGR